MSITKTTNPLPFTALKPQRFEDLCLGVVLRMRDWQSIKHHGRTGKDRGVDIYTEVIEESQTKKWFIQCKNYQKITYFELRKIINEVVKQNLTLPDHYLLILSCDVSRDNWEKLKVYAATSGLLSVDMITGSVLESMLFTRHHDLLYVYFGIDIAKENQSKINKIKRRLASKKRFEGEFIREGYKKGREIIVHDVYNDDLYPETPDEWPRKYNYFKVEFFGTYHRGLSVVTGIDELAVNQDGGWRKCKPDETLPKDWYKINALRICNLPYDTIVAEDFDGDEYYRCLHLYCEFSYAGNPYDEIWYDPTEDFKKLILFLDKDKEIIQPKV